MSQLIELATNAQRSSKPPLVNYVSCSCFQPEINPNAHRSENSWKNRTEIQSPLLPGLSDDVAIACLIRVPRIEHTKLRSVCKRWNHLLSENLFYSLRKNHGMAEEWVYVFRKSGGKISVVAFDPIYKRLQPLPPVPEEFSESLYFGCEVLSGYHLYLVGGIVPLKGSMKSVIFYCARKNKWCGAPDMLQERHWQRFGIGSCVINNRLYVAGGKNRTINSDIRFAEVYDPIQNKWSFISELSLNMQSPFLGFVHNGKWFLKGRGFVHNNVIFVSYSPETDTWSPVTSQMTNGCPKNFISLNGQLYGLIRSNHCSSSLTVYDEATDSWKLLMCGCYAYGLANKYSCNCYAYGRVVAVVPLNGKLCIIDEYMNITLLVDVSSTNKQVKGKPYYIWEYIGRQRFEYEVVCCRVLGA